MALINCPECSKQISDKAIACPYCVLPSDYYCQKTSSRSQEPQVNDILKEINLKELKNGLIAFDRDYMELFSRKRYIDSYSISMFNLVYEKYYKLLENDLILQYIKTNAAELQIDDLGLNWFLTKMRHLNMDIETHNNNYVEENLNNLKDYFDHIMDELDPNIKLDEE